MNKKGGDEMAAASMKRFAKKKKKKEVSGGAIVAVFFPTFPKGPVNLARSQINVYLKQLAPCSLADGIGCSGEIGQQGVRWAPNPPEANDLTLPWHPGVEPSSLKGRAKLCVM